ncbi:uncharacterized protein SAZU_0980 [Streptomyces azureus]|uniref:Uncharacterized protein n=1 Tax=Streptomyces azureus TaxID=146537 RepID=A0A0K8PER1_STRAJ|nr:uncharacterized protein SAZU_0980 [Streptomyces azureus]
MILRSLFGEPGPMLRRTPLIYRRIRIVDTVAGLAEGREVSSRAAAPAAWGAAIEVPKRVAVAVSLVCQPTVIDDPGGEQAQE